MWWKTCLIVLLIVSVFGISLLTAFLSVNNQTAIDFIQNLPKIGNKKQNPLVLTSETWVKDIVLKFPFDDKLIEGTTTAGSTKDSALFYGRYFVASGFNKGPDRYLGVKNKYGEFIGRQTESTIYLRQTFIPGAEGPTPIERSELKTGDKVVFRMKYDSNFPIIIEVWKLELKTEQGL